MLKVATSQLFGGIISFPPSPQLRYADAPHFTEGNSWTW